MMEITDKKYFAEVVENAKKAGLLEQFEGEIAYLANFACGGDRPEKHTKCVLYPERPWPGYAATDFGFVMYVLKDGEYVRWFNGGLLYHGPHDRFGSGDAPTFAVTLNATHGWSVHT